MDKNVLEILKKFEKGGYETAVVGGAVRAILTGKKAVDWDLTTSAKPEEILRLFPGAFYNNRFGTVGIKVDDKIVEATTYRKEQDYTDGRHPDKVVWGNSLEEDLARRDFTINAIALRFTHGKLSQTPVDPFGGQKDLGAKLIRTVGKADKRFSEDALRLIRAVRLAATLNFKIEKETKASIEKNSKLIGQISGERVRAELFKIVVSEFSAEGILLMRETGLLAEILPELDVCFDVEQKSPKRHHVFDVGTHCVMSMKHCPSGDTIVRLATLFHDIGKAKVANVTEEGVRTFYNHEVVGARQVSEISKRLQLSGRDRDRLFKLVRWHQFSVNENQTDKALRRFIRNVGLENVEDMMDLRIGDRLGGGLQQPESWRLKLFRKRIKEVLTKPFTVADLKVNGNDVMKVLHLKPGKRVGDILKKLFEEVMEDAKKNEREYLMEQIKKVKA